ncbi:MAG: nucleoside-diphosphate sugar epimerase/dehydratase [Bryobacteraceae bacterium]
MSILRKLLDPRPLANRLLPYHRWLVRAVQVLLFAFAALSAFQLRFDFSIPIRFRPHVLVALCVWVVVKTLVFNVFGLDRGWWRYSSIPDFLRLAGANFAASALSCLALIVWAPRGFPRSLYVLDFLLCFVLTAAIRITVRIIADLMRTAPPGAKKRTLIYGAGDAGVSLLREIRQTPSLQYDVLGFIDDSPAKTGASIHRVRVLGSGSALPEAVQSHAIEIVLIALPAATGSEMMAVLQHCNSAGVSYKTVPGIADIIESGGLASQIRDVAVEDLLGRNPVRLDETSIFEKIQDRVVMVTGAAGSIGSELCRQIARFQPRAIVGFEIAETALFHLDGEMRRTFPNIPFYPEIGSIQNQERLADVLRRHAPTILYHAAAYKHVPMMEDHPFEAIENNVFGTWNVATTASRHGVADFVMISSDKAVRPTNVMGATKRVAELLVHELQNGGTRYMSVRFGNVLGSSGSVIPLFKNQIARGGPVMVTHPEMRRYFMTIPEASQLVLQASSMGSGGEIFVLDMGQPVRILDLARNLILLSGFQPERDIRIEFSGVRPGEKLYEELNTLDEETLPTYHEKIKIFAGNGLPSGGMAPHLEILRQCCAGRDTRRLILELKELLPDYNPSGHVLRRALEPEQSLRRMASAVGSSQTLILADTH